MQAEKLNTTPVCDDKGLELMELAAMLPLLSSLADNTNSEAKAEALLDEYGVIIERIVTAPVTSLRVIKAKAMALSSICPPSSSVHCAEDRLRDELVTAIAVMEA